MRKNIILGLVILFCSALVFSKAAFSESGYNKDQQVVENRITIYNPSSEVSKQVNQVGSLTFSGMNNPISQVNSPALTEMTKAGSQTGTLSLPGMNDPISQVNTPVLTEMTKIGNQANSLTLTEMTKAVPQKNNPMLIEMEKPFAQGSDLILIEPGKLAVPAGNSMYLEANKNMIPVAKSAMQGSEPLVKVAEPFSPITNAAFNDEPNP